MPIYEFRCQQCHAKFSILVGMTQDAHDEVCPKCGSKEIGKLVSRFVRGRDEDARIDELADRLELMGEPEDDKTMREMVREVGKAMDEDLSDEMEEMYEMDQTGEGADEL